jgi:hypothetical protein
MKPLLAINALVLFAACAKTEGPAPGQAAGDAVVVTYYYLNF